MSPSPLKERGLRPFQREAPPLLLPLVREGKPLTTHTKVPDFDCGVSPCELGERSQ